MANQPPRQFEWQGIAMKWREHARNKFDYVLTHRESSSVLHQFANLWLADTHWYMTVDPSGSASVWSNDVVVGPAELNVDDALQIAEHILTFRGYEKKGAS